MVGSKHLEMKTASSQIQCRAFMLHIQCENHAFNAWGSYNIWWYLTFSEQRAASYDPAWNERKDHHFWFLLLESWSPAQHTRAYGSSIPDEWTFAYASTQCEAMTDGSMRTYFLVWGIVNYDENHTFYLKCLDGMRITDLSPPFLTMPEYTTKNPKKKCKHHTNWTILYLRLVFILNFFWFAFFTDGVSANRLLSFESQRGSGRNNGDDKSPFSGVARRRKVPVIDI